MGWDDVVPDVLAGSQPHGLPGEGSVDGVRLAARTARLLADELRDAARQARSVAGVDWRSAAAGAFRQDLARCVADLDGCAADLDEAAAELARFAAGAEGRLSVLRRLAGAVSWPAS
jgi:hypothetical protein